MLRAIPAIPLLLGSGFLLAAPVEVAPAPRLAPPVPPAVLLDRAAFAEVKDNNRLLENLRFLSDEIGPRVTGSSNLERANKWAAERMKATGLTNVRLEPWEIPVGWQRGTVDMKLVEPATGRSLHAAAMAWTPGTAGKVTGPVVVLDVKTKDDLAKYKGKLKNAIVLRGKPATVNPITDLSYGPGTANRPGGLPPKKDGETAPPPKKDAPPPLVDFRSFRKELSEFLKTEEAAVLCIDAGKPHGLLITTGSWREGDRATPQDPMPTVFLAHEHYELLTRLASRPGDPPTQVEVEVKNEFVPGPVTVFNTVGEVTGSEKPDEFVVVGAHLDSWDLATGTTDNGTGSCVVLEAARTVAALASRGYRPKRTIRFVLFAGEEQGLHGSKSYAKTHKDELPKTSAAFVHDTGTGKVLGFGLQGREAVRKVLEPELESLKELDGWTGSDLRAMGGTDHLSFEAVGVPGFACRQDMDEYRLTHHTQSDTFDKAKGPNLIQGAQVLAVASLRVANLPDLLPREKPPEKKEPKAPADKK